MNISERLDVMRQAEPGCNLVAFGDLGTRLVLRSSAATQQPQEYLDQLCAQAEQGFGLQDLLGSQEEPHQTNEVLVITPRETRIFVRSSVTGDTADNDAILCVCNDEQTAQSLIQPAKAVLDDLLGPA